MKSSSSIIGCLAALVLAGGICAATAGAAPAQDHTQASVVANTAEAAVPLYSDLGEFHFAVTSATTQVQQYFDQGMRLYFAFNHGEAVRAFQYAQQLDPGCAMCYWGEALALGPNINLPMDTPSADAAYRALQQAQATLVGETEREVALVAALAQRYASPAPVDRAALDQAYADAMAALAQRYPDDNQIGVLYAESLLDLRPWDYWTGDKQPQPGIAIALEKLEQAMTADANHPGACHFYIHAVEAAYPERAVPCAERLAALMPGAGHLVHMPGHIYIRVGRYLDAVAANEHAVHADETYIRDQQPGMGMYTAGYYPHNYDFMAFAAMMIGRSATAITAAERVTSLLPPELFGSPGMDFLQHWSVRPLLLRVRFARWQEILDTQESQPDRLHARAIRHYARGRALLASGSPAAADQELLQLRELAQQLVNSPLKMEFNRSADLVAIAERVLTGWQLLAAGNTQSGLAALESAVTLEDRLFYGEPPEWSVPTRQDLGAAQLQAGNPVQAERFFREDLAKFPDNGWSLYGLQQALLAQGRQADAEAVGAALARVWATADVEIARIY